MNLLTMRITLIFFGVGCGAFVGFALGVIGAIGLGYWSQWMHPEDASAGSVAIVVIGTAPGGAILGGVLGGVLIDKRPRLFLTTVIPLAVLFFGLHLTLEALRNHDVPRNYVLRVSGQQDEEFIGEVRVDGKLHKHKGRLPAEFEYQALTVELAFALPNAKDGERIAVEVLIDGRKQRGGKEHRERRIAAKYMSFGYSETFGGTSSSGECDLLLDYMPASQK